MKNAVGFTSILNVGFLCFILGKNWDLITANKVLALCCFIAVSIAIAVNRFKPE
jgi:hypothetical protein